MTRSPLLGQCLLETDSETWSVLKQCKIKSSNRSQCAACGTGSVSSPSRGQNAHCRRSEVLRPVTQSGAKETDAPGSSLPTFLSPGRHQTCAPKILQHRLPQGLGTLFAANAWTLTHQSLMLPQSVPECFTRTLSSSTRMTVSVPGNATQHPASNKLPTPSQPC